MYCNKYDKVKVRSFLIRHNTSYIYTYKRHGCSVGRIIEGGTDFNAGGGQRSYFLDELNGLFNKVIDNR